jgi:hypothetical protein
LTADRASGPSTASGIYNATYYATIDAPVKPDGTIDYETRQIHTTDDGDTILMDFTGTSIRESPTHNRFVGENTFQTSSKKFAWLNGIKSRHEASTTPSRVNSFCGCTGRGSAGKPGHTARARQINKADFVHAPDACTCFVLPGRFPIAATWPAIGADAYSSLVRLNAVQHRRLRPWAADRPTTASACCRVRAA